MKFVPSLLIALLLAMPATAQDGPRVINVTADSAPGWLPSVDDENAALDLERRFFAALDATDYVRAYALQSDGMKKLVTAPAYAAMQRDRAVRLGRIVSRRNIKLTWTKDPADAPAPGTYAAIDVAGRYALAEHECGFIILYRPPAGGSFAVAREEVNFITDVDLAAAERKGGATARTGAIAKVTAHCPNQ